MTVAQRWARGAIVAIAAVRAWRSWAVPRLITHPA